MLLGLLTWNNKAFPDPGGFISWIHQQNKRVSLNIHARDYDLSQETTAAQAESA